MSVIIYNAGGQPEETDLSYEDAANLLLHRPDGVLAGRWLRAALRVRDMVVSGVEIRDERWGADEPDGPCVWVHHTIVSASIHLSTRLRLAALTDEEIRNEIQRAMDACVAVLEAQAILYGDEDSGGEEDPSDG